MSSPEYFSYLKNVNYAAKVDKAGNVDYMQIKDYFRAMRVRDDIFAKDSLYSEYVVKNGERPDQLSKRFYDDEKFYWIILQVNNIVDYNNDWPLSFVELEDYINRKYGVAGSNEIYY